ncbi:MAG: oligosaccharide flippase family protein [Chloroflexota bacterium]
MPDVGADDAARKHIRGSSLLFVGRLISVVANMVVQVLLVRYLGRTDFGAFAYALSVVSLVQLAITLGMDRAVPRFLAMYDERSDHPKLLGTVLLSIGSILALGVVVVALAQAIGIRLLGQGQVEAAALLSILIFLAPIRALEEVQLGILATFAKPRAIFLRRNVLAPVLNLVVVGLLVLRDADATFVAVGYVVAAALGLALSFSLAASALATRGVGHAVRERSIGWPLGSMLVFALPLLTTDALYVLINSSDAIFLLNSHGADAVAAIRAVVPIATLNLLVMTAFTPLYTPLLARLHERGEDRAVADLYWQTAIWVAVITFPFLLGVIALALPLTVLLFGQGYASSAPLLVILCVGYYVNAALGFNGLTVRILGRMRTLVLINLAAAGVNIGLNLLLVPPLGPLGAAIATTGTLVIHNVGKQLALGRTSVGAMRSRERRLYGTLVVAALATFVVSSVTGQDLIGWSVSAGVAAVAGLAVWVTARPYLRIASVFPEVRRLPFARVLFSA